MSAFATLLPEDADLSSTGNTDLPESMQLNLRSLEHFLADIERRAFRIAQIALRHEEDAFDAVQDAMLQLARHYSARPPAEWKPLFYRILENRIRDLQRRRVVRARVMAWMPWRANDEYDDDPIMQAPDTAPGPMAQLQDQQLLQALQRALRVLPARQRQAFLLRNLEGLDVAGTAMAMQCSEGSVKTHYFRALRALRALLGDHVDEQ